MLPEYEPETLEINALYLSRQYQPLVLRTIIDFLAGEFAGAVAPWDQARPSKARAPDDQERLSGAF